MCTALRPVSDVCQDFEYVPSDQAYICSESESLDSRMTMWGVGCMCGKSLPVGSACKQSTCASQSPWQLTSSTSMTSALSHTQQALCAMGGGAGHECITPFQPSCLSVSATHPPWLYGILATVLVRRPRLRQTGRRTPHHWLVTSKPDCPPRFWL